MTQEPSTQTRSKHAGARLMKWGLFLLGLGVLFCALGFGSTSAEIDPATFQTVRVQGSPTLFAWAVLLAGVAMTVAGYAKRMLAAVEARR